MRDTLNEFDSANFKAPMKYSFVAVMNDEGYPHLNLITTLEGSGGKTMTFGRNYAGRTKVLLEQKKDAGFMSLGMDMNFWSGKMRFRAVESEGALKEYYNSKPGSRYNTYFIYMDVYICDLLGIEGPTKLDLAALGPLIQSLIPKMPALAAGGPGGPISPVAQEILSRKTTGKFLCWQGKDGIPEFAPLFGAIPAGTSRMAFALAESAERLAQVPEGARVSLHALDMMTMHAVQLRGEYHIVPEGFGYIDIKQVYNPMPPRPALIYPHHDYEAVKEF